MASGGEKKVNTLVAMNPKIARMRELISEAKADNTGGWETCWEEGVTPWDLGQPTPVVPHLLQTGGFPKGRILVPGCGTGYDVVAIASPERFVVGLDISQTAIKKAKEMSSSSPNAKYFNFVAADFFTWQPTELIDVIFDYTFFVAVDPSLRPDCAKKFSELLKPDGKLLTLILLISDQDGGPPYNVTLADYERVLHPLGFKATSMVDNELAVHPSRKGNEKIATWKRI